MIEPARIAINQITTKTQWTLGEAIEGYARHGVHQIAIWRDKLADCGPGEAKKILNDNGMTVTGLNRAGPFLLGDGDNHAALDDARRAIDEAAELDAHCLMLFPGGLPPSSRDIAGAREKASEMIVELLPMTRQAGVMLALEPLHPMLAAERSCLNTMSAANDLCDTLGPGLGIVVDVYHVWWDPDLESEINRAGSERIIGFHVSDWLVPTRDLVTDRGMMGDGVIDIPGIRRWVEATGYNGPIEVEIFSATNWWRRDPDEVVRTCIERCGTAV